MGHFIREDKPKEGYLTGQLLVATPAMNESYFNKSVIYILSHNTDGAMGIIVNNVIQNLSSTLIFNHLNIDRGQSHQDMPIHLGGPVDSQRGFVLHTLDYTMDTLQITEPIALSSNLQILKDIAAGSGPNKSLLALGYAGWEAGQLENELAENNWFSIQATEELVFDVNNQAKWDYAIKSLGIKPLHFSPAAGHA